MADPEARSCAFPSDSKFIFMQLRMKMSWSCSIYCGSKKMPEISLNKYYILFAWTHLTLLQIVSLNRLYFLRYIIQTVHVLQYDFNQRYFNIKFLFARN